ncbi:hypothetical protein LBMAG42_40020 [Deltaproteobacteria bacterium]|nr:hypothetical protein LBMAG42_40020 [Deltaproteobacteria bacterium]
MRFSLLLLAPLFFLAGCPDETISMPPKPAPVKPEKLASGEYGVLVVGVSRAECEGLREQDLWGMKLPMSLRVNGTSNVADLAGFQLMGEFSHGNLLLESVAGPIVESSSDEEYEDVAEEGDDTRGGAASEGDEGEDREDRGDRDDRDEPDEDVDHGSRPEEMFMSLDLQVSSTRDASGVFSYEARGCSIEAQVVVRGFEDEGGKPEPMPVEEGEEEPEEAPEDPCVDGGSDCG